MAAPSKLALDQSEPVVVPETSHVGLWLTPAEVEALVERLCSCGTLLAISPVPRRATAGCDRRARREWCRLGERGGDGKRTETRFG